MKVLIVEDEHRIAEAIKQGLQQENYAVEVCYDGQDGYAAASADEYDIVLLDVMLPGLNGFEICARLRADNNHTPVLMLTAKDQSKDIVKGLNAGADDYLAKPFAFEVLLARIQALLRRPQQTVSSVLKAGNLELDTLAKTVQRGGVPISLSSKEFALLEYLMRNQNQVLSKNNIMSHVWDFDADILPNTVEVFVAYLRGKIDKPFKKQKPLLETVRGFGYKIAA